MQSTRPTVADIRALKGKRQISMLYVETPDEAAAANAAGIDMLSIIDPVWTPEMRAAAGSCFVQVGLLYGQLVTTEDYLRAAHRVTLIGAMPVTALPVWARCARWRMKASRSSAMSA